ncbi:MAG: indolepyruvate ferredoxin oxidoreductase family protein [Sulfitobacter sp.]
MTTADHNFTRYRLDDRYTQTKGRVFMTGTQALARIMLDQARRDRAAGLNTAGFVSGYRGSPLGGLDQELWRMAERLDHAGVKFLPAVNEDLGATAILGAQQAHLDPHAEVEGVFSMWYGKGPGVDRSGDALKHGNAYGSAPKGGVLVVAGDDHGCVSSSMPHQSDVAFMAWFMPTLNPASVAEYQSFGEYGFALSRFSGTWVGFKAISETVESGASVDLSADRVFATPDYTPPTGGLHIRLGDLPSPGIEVRLHDKLDAVQAFVEANPIDRHIYGKGDGPIGIVTTGKGHLDTMEALRLLGLDEVKCRTLGIDIYKIGMVWPLARRDALDFVRGKREVLVIEEKRGIIESQFKEAFYDWPGSKPARMVGKHDENLDELVPWTGELSPLLLAPIIAGRLDAFFPDEKLNEKARALTDTPPVLLNVSGANRTPYFCSGCPHNSSTKLPEGSKAASGIGCHVMASWMDRETAGFAQMGGEGVPWVAASLFNGGKHIFQNLGEGTWYHSGSLAIRQAVAAGTNITYKILYNDAVAMTGGQPVDGPVSAPAIAQAVRAEGVTRIAVVSDTPEALSRPDFPSGTTFDHRRDLDTVQRELRDILGVTVLIYVQTCATEKRRKRKRGQMDDPAKFVMINDLVCEGCGDCSLESNCLSVEPKKTEFGTKRQINQSTCNKDYSCLNGFCPSFVTIEGGTRRKKSGAGLDIDAMVQDLPLPDLPQVDTPYNLLVTGVGGTGVVTVGALISMAAHLEGKGASVLDFTGFAQKFGTVLGYVRIAATPGDVHQVRIDQGSADAVIGCDMVVSSASKASAHYRSGTKVVLNRAEMPTGDLVLNRDADLKIDQREQVIADVVGTDNLAAFDANKMAERLMGDAVFANVMMLGFAWQQALVPVSLSALYQAIELNAVAPEKNKTAFAFGRMMAVAPEKLSPVSKTADVDQTPKALITRRMAFLTDYQDAAYAARYKATLDAAAPYLTDVHLIMAAKSLFKLMAYKDEYEVARLHGLPEFATRIAADFEGDYRVKYHLAPPLWPTKRDTRGRPMKRQFGPWMAQGFKLLAHLKGLRGTWANVFAYGADRKLEVGLIEWFEDVLKLVVAPNIEDAQKLAILAAPQGIRGYGPIKEAAAEKVQAEVSRLLGQV